jgi:cholesterol transport system auxiliary component
MRRAGIPILDRRQLVLGASAVLAAGCGGIQLLPKPMTPQLYVLRPQLMTPMGAPVRWRLAVGTPDAPASLDTERIALTRSTTTMDYFANAAWNDRAPLLLERLLIQAFEQSGRIMAVTRDTAATESDYLLQTEIRGFEAHYDSPDGAPQIMVAIQARLARMPQRDIVGSLNATQQAQAASNSLDSIVLAFDQATAAALAQIVNWALAAPQPPPSP